MLPEATARPMALKASLPNSKHFWCCLHSPPPQVHTSHQMVSTQREAKQFQHWQQASDAQSEPADDNNMQYANDSICCWATVCATPQACTMQRTQVVQMMVASTRRGTHACSVCCVPAYDTTLLSPVEIRPQEGQLHRCMAHHHSSCAIIMPLAMMPISIKHSDLRSRMQLQLQ